jgi:hypothetical protein
VGASIPETITVLIALAVLVLVMRWVFGAKRGVRRPPIDAARSEELGLLAVVATALSRDGAERTSALLGDAGIRSSMSRRRDGNYDVLVFAGDLPQARQLLA